MPEGIADQGRTVHTEPQRDPRSAPGFQPPEEVPFSDLGEEFIDSWGKNAEGEFEGEHVEVTGQSGSGKSYALATILHLRALRRDSAIVAIATKLDDKTIMKLISLGWPRVRTFDEVRKHRQCVFWPEPKGIADEREKALEQAVYNLLASLWRKNANVIVFFDEIGTVEGLPGPPARKVRLKKLVQQYWREGRALGISVVASKQRPIGVVRDQHSETRWKLVFPPADMGDMERFAELLGRPRDWQPVLESLDQEQHQFVIRNNVTKDAYITWIDFKLEDLPHLPEREEHTVYGKPDRQTS